MKRTSFYVINGITVYRIIAAPVLIVLIIYDKYDLFKWLLGISFFTDLIDGFLARKYKVNSILGAQLDSIGDDLTVLSALIGLFVFEKEFVMEQIEIIIFIFILFAGQLIIAFFKYNRMTSFHTHLAKISAVLQGLFFLLIFFTDRDFLLVFYLAAVFTIVELIEEILITLSLDKWEANIRSYFWLMKRKRKSLG